MSDEISLYKSAYEVVIRDGDTRKFVAENGVYVSDHPDAPWSFVESAWPESTLVWSGSRCEWDTLRALSKTPAELIENAKALTADKQAARASGDATILDFLESCGICATDLEEARKIVIHTLDETRELRAKLDQGREAHEQCSDALRSANKRADDAEDKIAQMRTILGPKDPIVAGGFYRDSKGALWYVPRYRVEVTASESFACGPERWFCHGSMPDTSDWRFVAQGAESLSWLHDVRNEASRLKLSWRV